jgi:glycosyltransferase involved in cell wall biosynthesis
MLLPDASPEAMADALVQLCTGPAARWAALSAAAHDRAHGYSWDDATAALDALLQDGVAAVRKFSGPSTR